MTAVMTERHPAVMAASNATRKKVVMVAPEKRLM